MLIIPHQREGAISNAHVGRAFEEAAKQRLFSMGLVLQPNFKIPLGVEARKKLHAFDLGCGEQKVLVECKSHKWTKGAIIPSAKLSVWNEAMFYFYLAPREYRKIMFVLKHCCERRNLTLVEHYLKNHSHLVPSGVEFWEFDEVTNEVKIAQVK
jgi:hypothetical protein